MSIVNIEMHLTIQSTFGKPIVREVFRGVQGQVGFTLTRMLADRFINSFGYTQKLSEDQIDSFTVDALEHFEYETLEDMLLFFKMARTGKFGTTKHSVDSNTVFGEWLPKYLELKAKAREERYVKEKNQRNQLNNKQAVAYTYQQARQKREAEQQQQYVDKLTENFDRQMLEDTITSWQKDDEMKAYVPLLKRKRLTIKNK